MSFLLATGSMRTRPSVSLVVWQLTPVKRLKVYWSTERDNSGYDSPTSYYCEFNRFRNLVIYSYILLFILSSHISNHPHSFSRFRQASWSKTETWSEYKFSITSTNSHHAFQSPSYSRKSSEFPLTTWDIPELVLVHRIQTPVSWRIHPWRYSP